jgi:RepB DNA-primase from phage plasmid
VIVESSPGRWQCYRPLTEPVDPCLGEELNQRLAYALGADTSGWDLTQLLRLPGTPNGKYWDAPRVRLLEMSDVRHDPHALANELPPISDPVRSPVPGGAAVDVGDAEPLAVEKLSRAGLRVWLGEAVKRTPDGRLDRSASLVRIARVLYEAGASRAAIVAGLAERDLTLGWRKYADRPDAAAQYQRILDLIERGPQPQRL